MVAATRLGPERIKGAYAWRSLMNTGTVIIAGSDFPVESANPLWGFYAAVTRSDQTGFPQDGCRYPTWSRTYQRSVCVEVAHEYRHCHHCRIRFSGRKRKSTLGILCGGNSKRSDRFSAGWLPLPDLVPNVSKERMRGGRS